MTKTKRAKAIPHYVVLKWNKNNPLVSSNQKEWITNLMKLGKSSLLAKKLKHSIL